jgi:SAM-dependent methyltransferase
MNSSILIKWFGFPATLVHGDTLVLDRWNWLKNRLPLTSNSETVLDVGCGTGAFTIGAARRGYIATGVSWDKRNQSVAEERNRLCGGESAKFVIGDVRKLDTVDGLDERYDIVICLECIEHILNDHKLFQDMASMLKPGGRLLLTTPNYYYVPITSDDRGPFLTEETGWHMRRGYTTSMLEELAERSGLVTQEVSYCSGFLSQKVTKIWRVMGKLPLGAPLHWLVTLPLRLLPIILPDLWISRVIGWPLFSICIECYKPRSESHVNIDR